MVGVYWGKEGGKILSLGNFPSCKETETDNKPKNTKICLCVSIKGKGE